jgi:Domain of unknown function (DUF4276)
VRIEILVEGKTERALKSFLLQYLQGKLAGRMPKLDFLPYRGRIPTSEKLKRLVQKLLQSGKVAAVAVIALAEVYTGTQPPDFKVAADAKQKMRAWVGQEPSFYPHVALHDFEAWLSPYWSRIRKITRSNKRQPGSKPEIFNHGKSLADQLKVVFETGKYKITTADGGILKDQDLTPAINAYPELKAFINTIVRLAGGTEIP